MKTILVYLIFLELVLSCAAATYCFPPFSEADIPFGKEEVNERMRREPSFHEKSIPELRSIMTFGDYGEQQQAAEALVQAGDRETLLRVVYSLKQGNYFGVLGLGLGSSRQVIPYLMEDVAHGSIEDLSHEWSYSAYENIRFSATEIVATLLTRIEEFPESTREWLKYVKSGNSSNDIYDLSQKSKFLVEWWILNEQAFLGGRWSEVVPLPHPGSYPPRPKSEFVPEGPIPEVLPAKFPLDVPESFEDWSARIVHPERRDLRWVKLTFENGKWVEHPPIRLNPLEPTSAASRDVRRPSPPIVSVEHDALSQWPVWAASLALLAGLMLWFFRLRKTRSA